MSQFPSAPSLSGGSFPAVPRYFPSVSCSLPGVFHFALVPSLVTLLLPWCPLLPPWRFWSFSGVSRSFLDVPQSFPRVLPSLPGAPGFLPAVSRSGPASPGPPAQPKLGVPGCGACRDRPGRSHQEPPTEGLFCVPTVALPRWLRVARADDVRRGDPVNVI